MVQGRAKALMSNTIVFAVGNALTKLIQLVLMPLYTTYMTVGEYGTAELVNNLSDLLYPILCLCTFESVFRFAMERDVDKGELLAGALGLLALTIPVGCVVAAIAFWGFSYDLAWGCLALVVAVGVRTTLAQFARGAGKVKAFALSGVLNTFLLLAFSIGFLALLHLGIVGYIGALLLGNAGSAVYLVFVCRLWRYAGSRPRKALVRRMLAYSLPLLPNSLAWWLMNIFGRYVLLFFQGATAAGLYIAASKLPSLVNFLSTIFQQAWQISAAQELGSEDGIAYFSKVFAAFTSFLYCGCSLLIALSAPLAALLLCGEFFEGWRLVPLLLLVALASCIAAYFGTFYNAAKRTGSVFVSTVIGALVNIALAIALVNPLGIWGIPVAGLAGQLATVCYRMWDSRRYAPIAYDVSCQLFSVGILALQATLVTFLPESVGMGSSLVLAVALVAFSVRKQGTVLSAALRAAVEAMCDRGK